MYFLYVTLEAALRELTPRVLRYCIGFMGDRSLGEEVAQESLAVLVRQWRTSGPPRNIDAFVFTVAKRRSQRVLFQRRLLLPVEYLLNHRQPGPDPERTVIERDQRARLLSAIRRLPPAEREAVMLVIGDGQTLHNAANLCGVSLSAMKMRLSRARQRLLELVNDHHEPRND
jgi:RNA polymerase sigma-70 factor, ECF subfamily